ncbi:MAG: MFS transporter [Betaproteobacteria bacterium]|nr:MFS transporter [Betaproteobacteria bacterium]
MNPLFLLILLTAINHLAFVGVRLTVTLYAVRLEASPAVIGVLMALFAVVGAVTSVGVGRWIDRTGPRKPMLLSTLLVVAGTGLAFLWRDLAALFIVSAVVGTFYNVFFIAQQRLVGEYGRPEDRVANFSRVGLGFAAASFAGPLIAGFAIDAFGHSVAFALLALLPLVPFTVIWLNQRAFPDARQGHSRQAGGKTGGVLQLLRGKDLRRIYAVSALSASIWNIFMFLVPIYGAQIGLSASTIGVIIGSFSFGTIVVRVSVPLLTRRFTPWQLLIIALVFSSAGFIGFPAVTGAPMLILFSFLSGLGLGLSGPLSLSLLHDASPPDRIGEVVGLRVMLMNGSQTAVPLFAGAIGTALGVAPLFWLLAASLLAGSYAVRRQWRRGKG